MSFSGSHLDGAWGLNIHNFTLINDNDEVWIDYKYEVCMN